MQSVFSKNTLGDRSQISQTPIHITEKNKASKRNMTPLRLNKSGFLALPKSCLAIAIPLIFLAVTGLLSPYKYNLAPATAALETALILSSVFMLSGCKVKLSIFPATAVLYLIVSFLIAWNVSSTHYLDFIVAYKAFYYVALLSLYIGRNKFDSANLCRLFKILFFLFLVKYSYSKALTLTPNMGDRPGIYTENNFEIIFIILLYYIAYPFLTQKKTAILIGVSFLVFLSGSRSGLLALLVVFAFLHIHRINRKTVITLVGLISLAGLAYYVFDKRMTGGIESIDRFIFLQLFLREVSHWNLMNALFGSMPVTPLSTATCNALGFYQKLFSYANDGSCYSVVLHSYILRVIFDHGCAGLIFLFSFIGTGLRKSGFSKKQIACFLSVILATSLSVSALNNVYMAMILAIAFSLRQADGKQSRI